jgi:glutathione peroxidase
MKNNNSSTYKINIMTKLLIIGAIALTALQFSNSNKKQTSTPKEMRDTTIYDFKVAGLEGDTIDFAAFKGKKLMIVNTASKCGNTPQYAQLETLYEKYKDKLVIVGFPANNFGAQEPGTNVEIKEFCTKNYGVSFPMAAKVSVKGDDIAPIYKYLLEQSAKIGMPDPIKWNFTKFLLDEHGKLITVIFNKKSVLDQDITSQL